MDNKKDLENQYKMLNDMLRIKNEDIENNLYNKSYFEERLEEIQEQLNNDEKVKEDLINRINEIKSKSKGIKKEITGSIEDVTLKENNNFESFKDHLEKKYSLSTREFVKMYEKNQIEKTNETKLWYQISQK